MANANQDTKTKPEITIEEYARTKDSAHALLRVLDLENIDYDRRLRIINDILGLMNDLKKDSAIRKSIIEDFIYNGVLRHYLSEENKELAVKILNATSINSEAESVIYKLNFLIPNNDKFYEIYQQHNGSLDRISNVYKISESKILIMKAMECQKYLEEYNRYKKEKKAVSNNAMRHRTSETLKPEDEYTVGLNKLEDIMNRFRTQRKALEEADEEVTSIAAPFEDKKDDFEFPIVDVPQKLDVETKTPKLRVVSSKITIPQPPKQKPNNFVEFTKITDRIRTLSDSNKKKDSTIGELESEIQNLNSQAKNFNIRITDLSKDKADLAERYKEALNVIATLKQENENMISTNQKLIDFIRQISDELGMSQEQLKVDTLPSLEETNIFPDYLREKSDILGLNHFRESQEHLLDIDDLPKVA